MKSVWRTVAALAALAGCAVVLSACAPGTLLDASAITRLTGRGEEWVVVVYMSADNELEARAIEDLNEMEAAGLAGSGVTVVALVDRAAGYDASNGDWTGTRAYEIADDPDGVDGVVCSIPLALPALGIDPAGPDVELDMARPPTLAALLGFVAERYAPRRTALIVWGHGSGYRATGVDDASGGALFTAELADAVRGAGLDLIGFDTGFGASVEVAWELRGHADLMVASQSPGPADGWEYDDMLARFIAGDRSPDDLARAITGSFADAHATNPGASISTIRLDRLPGLMEALDAFSLAVHAETAEPAARDSVRATLFYDVEDFYTTPGDLSIDLADAARTIGTRYDFADAEAAALAASVADAIASSWSGDAHPRASGLSVHLIPLAADGTAAPSHDPAYFRGGTPPHPLAFVAASAWPPSPLDETGLLYRLFYEIL